MITDKSVLWLVKYILKIYPPTVPVVNYSFLILYRDKPVSIWLLVFSLAFLFWLVIAKINYKKIPGESQAEYVKKMITDKLTMIIAYMSIGLWFWSMYQLYIFRERTVEMGIIAVINLGIFVDMVAFVYFKRKFLRKIATWILSRR